ncbi:hypothetical protein [Catellatospora sichuanensis]|uniref:hypothetical protein n=1 Tax=Catellatospora sichuanensis TaxID=1969805 RepID=UPI0011841121|nr:hypothetical protein [Catellatospora sichuanensis]
MSTPPQGHAPIPDELARRYWQAIAVHGDDPATDMCVHCRRHRCPEWAYAVEQLILADLLDSDT